MASSVPPEHYRFGRFELQPDKRRLLVSGTPAHIGSRAFDLLVMLVERDGHLVTKDELVERVWQNVIVEENTLQAQVSALRKILGPDAIATVSGRGYRFALELTDAGAESAVPRHNLPQQLTSFIGREKEIAQVKELLGATRLLTLIGTGGCGKTRLALQVAGDLLESYPDGVWLVELATLAEPSLVPQTVAAILGLKEQQGRSLTQTISEHIASKLLLLVLDNAEHLLAVCAEFADAVLRRCAQLVILITSRERLGIAGEHTYRVPSLSVPDPKRDTVPEVLSEYESVRLFIERARLQQPHFAATAQNAPALASVCCRLDGIPLAIELAAARVRSMSVEEVNRRLDQRFGLLTAGSRTALPRHRTLRSLIDWSYDLLSDAEKAMLRRVSTFAGGWTLEAAEQVWGDNVDGGEALDLLTSLADKNLVLAEAYDGATRYGLLETLRLYARDRLRESGEEMGAQRQHLAYFLMLAEEAEPQLTASDQQGWFDRLETERDNLRAALSRSAAAGGVAPPDGLRLAGALWRFWSVRGYLFEGRRSLVEQLTLLADPSVWQARTKALHGAGVLARNQGDYAAAGQFLEEGIAIRRQHGDRRGVASSLGSLGNVASERGDYAAGRSFHEECLAIYRELNDRLGTASALNNLGVAITYSGDFRAARALHEESLALRRELGDRWGTAASLMNMALVDREIGDLATARELYVASEAIYQELGDQRSTARASRQVAIVMCDQGDCEGARPLLEESLASFLKLGDRTNIRDSLYGLAYSLSVPDPRRAAILWGAGERLREEQGVQPPPMFRSREDREVAGARAALADDPAFDFAWQEGRAMNFERAVLFALGAEKPDPDPMTEMPSRQRRDRTRQLP
jgi:predicted ATPase/DNA-binding winged helix-turn-helix (wHTH) protein